MMEAPEVLRLIGAQTWQLTLLIAVVALVVRFASRRRPFLAHALWLVVLLKCVTPPLWSSPGGVFCWLETAFRPAVQVATLTGQPLAAPRGIDFDAHNAATDLVVWVHDGNGGSELRGVIPRDDRIERVGWSLGLAAWFLVVWLTGTSAVMAIALWRWWRCWSQLCRQRIRHDAMYDAALSRLAKRLKLRRPVRLMVTASPIGPAVIGWMRPVIVLPEMIVQGKSPTDLEPILAHELLHVRRGDLWIGMLQVVSLGLWWFHPLVWFVNRWISREAERCCDEAVLAVLGCGPSRYARCLLDVLERKQLLRPVPAFPGVRPVEITSQRLERIMQLRQGCRNRTPWWCWLVALGLAAATLPGAAWVAAGDQPAELARPWQPQPILPHSATPLPPAANPVARAPLGEMVTRQYELADVLAKTRAELRCGKSDARSRIADEMAAAGGSESAKLSADAVQEEAGSLVVRDDQRNLTQPQLHWKGTTAIVRHDEQGHQRIADRIAQIRRYGFAQLLIEVQLIMARTAVVEKAVPAWRLSPVGIAEADDSSAAAARLNPSEPWAAEVKQRPNNRSVSSIEQQGPFQFQIVDANQWHRMEAVLTEDRSTNLLRAPKIVTSNGRSATVQSGCQRPFVVGLKDEEPQVEVITEGITLQVTPELIAAQPAEQGSREVAAVAHLAEAPQAKVAIKVAHSEILDVATRTINVAGRDKPVTLQVPRLHKSGVNLTVVAPLDQTLVIGGLQMQDEQLGTRSLLVTMTVRRVTPEGGETKVGAGVESASGDIGSLMVDEASFEEIPGPSIYPRVYNVADLVIPVPTPAVIRWSKGDNAPQATNSTDKATSCAPDFDKLISLIQSTIAPESWTAVGGSGAIEAFPTNLCLVIAQTMEVHQQITELLQQVRRLQDVQVALETRVLGVTDDFLQRTGVNCGPDVKDGPAQDTDEFAKHGYRLLTDEETGLLVRTAQDQARNGLLFAPKITVLSGQSTTLHLGDPQSPYALLLQPVASEDRKSVQLRFAAGTAEKTEFQENHPPLTIPEGQTLLIDPRNGLTPEAFGLGNEVGVPMLSKIPHVTKLFKNTREVRTSKVYLLVTPRIVVHEEELR